MRRFCPLLHDDISQMILYFFFGETVIGAGWSSPVARQAHNLKVVGSNPTPATKNPALCGVFCCDGAVNDI